LKSISVLLEDSVMRNLNNKRTAKLVLELASECLNHARVSPKAAQVLRDVAETYRCKAKRLYPTMKSPDRRSEVIA